MLQPPPDDDCPPEQISRFRARACGFVIGCAVVVGVFGYFFDPYAGGSNKTDDAINICTMMEAQCKAYLHKRGSLPTSLRELVAPTDGRSPLLDGGLNTLLDPWGNPYQYDPNHLDENGQADPIVFTVTPKGRQLMSQKRMPRSRFPW
ncbi:type II secretion system protein GspG [Limnoglobus roseus]|uniref:Uncharacterized protein n=1 Tax=Limnoglobus roseus TaxID=2598579 RepID=A0A5C1AJ04_9BACT|nr:type II secretion system protein GspG [Limnoglobus roseus]QEL18127.1 hypothetical protein PX52LOC_05141 [Limnoglobus roseus]